MKYWTFHDRDISPEGGTLEETNRNLDEMSDFVLELQLKTGVKLLWNTCNLFAHPRFVGRLPQNRIFRSFFLYYYIIIYYS